jgi:hypothetical protein
MNDSELISFLEESKTPYFFQDLLTFKEPEVWLCIEILFSRGGLWGPKICTSYIFFTCEQLSLDLPVTARNIFNHSIFDRMKTLNEFL